MPSKYSICASNNPRILETNPRKNRIIHEISTNPESTPLRTCFSWLHLFLGSLRSLLSDEKLHFRGSSWPPRPCNWSYPLNQPREKSSGKSITMWHDFFVSGQRMSKEYWNSTWINSSYSFKHGCLVFFFLSLFTMSSGYPSYFTWMW